MYVANVPSQGGRATSPPPLGTCVGARRPNVRWGGGPTSAPNVPTSVATSNVNVVRPRPSDDTDAHAPHSASELAPGAAVG
jgi:hypothetical protein